jgi:hypothetical protein
MFYIKIWLLVLAVFKKAIKGFGKVSPHLTFLDCGGQSGTGVGFLQVLRFTLPIIIPPNSPYS